MRQSWIFTPCPSSTPSSFPTKGVGEWLCLGWVSPRGFVRTSYIVPPHRVPPGYQAVTVTAWLHLFETIGTRTWKQLHLGVVHWYSFMVSYTGMNGKDTLIQIPRHWHYQFNCICGLHKIQSFGIVKAVCLYFFPFFFLAWTRPKILTVIIRFWLAVNWFLSMSTPSFCMSSDWAQPSAQAAQIEASTS